ncbi:MAG: hypothetical protein K6F59_02135 [Gammaproteobacteria bacterium]|nr:hypothetical protein [Gammaproteobacteria bacterium]
MKIQMKIQKIICFLALFASAFAFIFSLGVSTTVYNLNQTTAFMPGVIADGYYDAVQEFNHKYVLECIGLIVLAVLLFITQTSKRRNYYVSNYVAILAFTGYSLFVAITSLQTLQGFKETFLNETDFEMWKMIHEMIDAVRYTESTFWFDINMIMLIIVVIASALLVLNLVWKIVLMVNEAKLLKKSEEARKLNEEVK